jgi:FlaA1/EpsC-like NDP-sugar epimerase
MGEPVSILELGRDLIASSGKEIGVEFTGLRPGEKLREQLTDEFDRIAPSRLANVFRITPAGLDAYMTSADVAHLETIARTMESAIVRQRVFAHLDDRLGREERAAG